MNNSYHLSLECKMALHVYRHIKLFSVMQYIRVNYIPIKHYVLFNNTVFQSTV